MPTLPTEDQLATHLSNLLDLLQPMIHDRALPLGDHYGFMCMCFSTRQVEHGESLIKVRPSFDCELIARSMLEGYCQHAWAAKDPEERGERWRGYAFVHDWALLHEKKDRGETVAKEEEERIRDGMAEYGDLFLTKAGKATPPAARPLPPENYHKNWFGGGSLKDLFDAVELPTLYDQPYRRFSEWHHWDLAGLVRSLSWDESGTQLTALRKHPSPGAFAVGIQCLLQTAERVEKHMPIGLDEALSAFHDEYVAEFHDLGGAAIV